MAMIMRQSISVIFPAANEEENIAQVVAQAINFLESLVEDWEIIVVDDGSRDRTGAIIDELSRRHSNLKALHHGTNQGYGAALKSGIQAAQKDLVFFCDADLQFHLSELLLPMTWIEQYDLVIGYRANRRDPLHRRLNALGWKVLVRLLLGLSVRDIDCAFKLFRRVVFEAIEIDAIGAMVNTAILVPATRMGFKLREVPVTHFPRLHGSQSGANLRVICKAFCELVQLYRKLWRIRPIVTHGDRRQASQDIAFPDRRRGDRRQVMLPINFSDRRRRTLRLEGRDIPLESKATTSP